MTGHRSYVGLLAVLACLACPAAEAAQSTTGTIQVTVRDEHEALVPGATVTIRNVATNAAQTAVSGDGFYRFLNVPVGKYTLTVERGGFSKYVRSGITLSVNQDPVVDVQLPGLRETIEVHADAPLINKTTPEVGVLFDTTRIAELPVQGETFRDVVALVLSAPGVTALGSGQLRFAFGTNFSSNGMRPRSNNLTIDGQDNNAPGTTGQQQPINNTDTIQEVRLITNQFAAEFGRAAGAIVSAVTKSGSNAFRGSAFWFHNDESLNSRSNLDKAAKFASAPFHEENQFGGTLGGPVARDRTFFFGSYQRWTNRELGSGVTLKGAPTDSGRAVLQSVAAGRPQIAALLRFVPAGTANGQSASFVLGGQTYTVPLGDLTGSSSIVFDNDQAMGRVDHVLSRNHTITARYLLGRTPRNSGTGQVTPPGLTTVNTSNEHSLNAWMNSVLGTSLSNEFRVAWSHRGAFRSAQDPASEEIPSLEIAELGMSGSAVADSRTAIGLAINLPNSSDNDLYQFQDNLTYLRGRHLMKAGLDVRDNYVKSSSLSMIRGLLRYDSLQSFVLDTAETAAINKPLPGGQAINYNRWWDQYYFAQDEWKLQPALTLSLGLRYELPGNNMSRLLEMNRRIVAANGNDAVFRLTPVPGADRNNLEPRVGFNWVPRTSGTGLIGFLTGDERLSLRGGYARTHDYAFLTIAQNIASSFPFVAAITPSLANAFTSLQNTPAGVPAGTANLLARTVVADDFRSPSADQFSVDLQRQIRQNLAVRIGYVGTFGKGLFQTIDGNPRPEFCGTSCTTRVDPTRGVVRLRANTAKSWYHSIQTGVEKRLSLGLSAALHYTWSRYIDTASDIFNPSAGEIGVAQDSYDIGADKGRSSYDRPHRLTGNFVWQLPVMRSQQGIAGTILGGWQVGSFFTFQSGAPFTPLNGTDPTGALSGIAGLVGGGTAIRPNLNTNLDLSTMTIPEIIAAGGAAGPGSLFRRLCGMPSAACPGERVGNAPRNLLRADGIGNVDVSLIKNTRVRRSQNLQIRVEMFDVTNTRNFGIPDSQVNSAGFLNQWATDGGARRIWVAARYTF